MRKTTGQVAYEAYRASMDTRQDGPGEGWEALPERVQVSFQAAADAAVDFEAVQASQGQREIPSRWRPVEDFMTRVPEDIGPAVFEPPPLDDAPHTSLPVTADLDEGRG